MFVSNSLHGPSGRRCARNLANEPAGVDALLPIVRTTGFIVKTRGGIHVICEDSHGGNQTAITYVNNEKLSSSNSSKTEAHIYADCILSLIHI